MKQRVAFLHACHAKIVKLAVQLTQVSKVTEKLMEAKPMEAQNAEVT